MLNWLNYDTLTKTKEAITELEAVKVVIEGICPTAIKPHANEIYISIKEDLTAKSIPTWKELIKQLLILVTRRCDCATPTPIKSSGIGSAVPSLITLEL